MSPRQKTFALQVYRIGVLLAIAWLIRSHSTNLRVQGNRPISLTEVRQFLPNAADLKPDHGPRGGLLILNQRKQRIGYAVRTMPKTRDIVGYSGPIDVMVVFGKDDSVLGTSIRQSYDTPSHVEDVEKSYLFMEAWNGKPWEEISTIENFGEHNIWAVSGASRTSEAMMESITARLRTDAAAATGRGFAWRWQDTALLVLIILGAACAFVKDRRFKKIQPVIRIGTFVVLGFVLGDLLAQSLFIGWIEARIPWAETPGVVLLALAAFLVPAITQQPLYCQYLCPHGHAQRWLMKYVPARFMVKLDPDSKWSLRWLPALLLGIVLLTALFELPVDLAGIEPFHAYLWKAAGIATIAVAIISLIVSAFIPMAYCKFGCPTGLLFTFVRRPTHNRWAKRDTVALGFLVIAFILIQFHGPIQDWLLATP